jgi:hypothetical protein
MPNVAGELSTHVPLESFALSVRMPFVMVYCPTATQDVALTHDTDANADNVYPW